MPYFRAIGVVPIVSTQARRSNPWRPDFEQGNQSRGSGLSLPLLASFHKDISCLAEHIAIMLRLALVLVRWRHVDHLVLRDPLLLTQRPLADDVVTKIGLHLLHITPAIFPAVLQPEATSAKIGGCPFQPTASL